VPNGGHVLACTAARAAICAGKQNKFWEMHDRIFDGQDSLSAPGIEQFAGAIGLDAGQYQACLKDPATEQQLQKEIQWGDLIQLQSTPTLIVNGRRLSGARSPQDLEALLKHLEGQGAGSR
jgi:protein-disulfide isomerase